MRYSREEVASVTRRIFSVGAAFLFLVLACTPAAPESRKSSSASSSTSREQAARLPVPATGRITVAFVISHGATVIDFAGPWEVFQDVTNGYSQPFELFTVAASRDPIRATGGLQIVPDYTFEDAPNPDIIVVPAQRSSQRMLSWLRSAAAKADLTMSVCTGAFILAEAGLLDGRAATTHHEFYGDFQRSFPKVDLRRDVRYVEGPRIASAGGLTSGIDLALRVVARYFGHETAQRTATYMEHISTGWHKDSGVWDGAPAKPESTP